MTRRCLVVFPGLVALGVERRSLRVQGSNRLREEENQTISSFFSQMFLITDGANTNTLVSHSWLNIWISELTFKGLFSLLKVFFPQSSLNKAVDEKLADTTKSMPIDAPIYARWNISHINGLQFTCSMREKVCRQSLEKRSK